MTIKNTIYNEVIEFWFFECSPEQWWIKDSDFDQKIKKQFSSLHEKAILGELHPWRNEPLGRLAEIIILDQFSRNIHRDTPKAFSSDGMALVLAQEAIRLNVDKTLTTNLQAFLYMPYMHSESKEIHNEAVRLFKQEGLEQNYEFELKHKKIIDRFGRYPHRNKILGRDSTSDEIAFLKQPDSSF